MRLCEKLVRSPALSPAERDLLQQARRIVADDVAEYYYMGTDQEFWQISRDFPNLAPPFETFFIECRAPRMIVSRAYGTRLWTPDMGYEWGNLCRATSRQQRLAALADKEGRQHLWSEMVGEVRYLQATLQNWPAGQPSAVPLDNAHSLVYSPALVEARLARGHRLLTWMRLGWWEQVRRLLESDPWEWSIDLWTFVHFSRSEHDLSGPVWWTRLRVRATGEVEIDGQGAAIWEDRALGWVNQALTSLRERSPGEYASAVQEARLSLAPLLHTALLTISFLHCHNVTLSEVRPPYRPLSNRQRRRGEHARPPLAYHVLDIRPLHEILRPRGQPEHTGSRRALHTCRGHFAHYQKRGLFGKYQGTFWRPQHMRGNAEQGVRSREYRVHLPARDPRMTHRRNRES
jgi:hypothetical protein